MEEKRCVKCNNIINKTDKFCTICGAKQELVNPPVHNKTNNYNNKIVLAVIITAVISLILMLSTLYVYDNYFSNSHINASNKNVKIDDTGIADAVEKVYDSVVVVENYTGEQLYANGSGFVFKTDTRYGYILTNNHVLSKSTSVKVVFSDKKEVSAEVVGADEYSDVAVLKVDKKYVKEVAIMGDNSKMRVGDTTFAVGAPLDSSKYSWSVTRGVLSGKDRTVSSGSSYMNVLQTDTPINTGNSGGPLCNGNGEVIGITNMKLANDQIEGIGFAIPIETALNYANKFMTGKEIARPYVGVTVTENSSFFGGNTNVVISGVEEDSPAAKAGIKSGDIIKKINNDSIEDASYFKYKLYSYKIGDKIKLTIERNGKEQTIDVILGQNTKKA